MLPNELIGELYERYKIDFEMFDYSLNEFINNQDEKA